MRVRMAWRGCAWACGWEGHKEVLDLEHLKHRAAAVADEGLSPESKGGTCGTGTAKPIVLWCSVCTASGAEQTTRGPTTALAVPILLLLVPFRPPGTGPVGEGKHRRARDGCN